MGLSSSCLRRGAAKRVGGMVEGAEMVVVGKVEGGVYTWLKIRSALRARWFAFARSATARTFPPGRPWSYAPHLF
jgi:hypothetical protein